MVHEERTGSELHFVGGIGTGGGSGRSQVIRDEVTHFPSHFFLIPILGYLRKNRVMCGR
jgi:hypothetical protein